MTPGGCIVITLTDIAAEKVKELIEDEGEADLALRVAVRPGGCSGYSYEMFFDSETEAEDMSQFFGEIRVVSDPMSAQLLDGATLDFKDGLMGSGFAIDNPNAQRTCGCGSSFS
ncbi:MAG: iron-sulfur cluster insertion protein ErpA [Actinomycetota bacterium]|nr:iron-sulfur cluster insertion protein ErpA [Actinomycetota bacterium]